MPSMYVWLVGAYNEGVVDGTHNVMLVHDVINLLKLDNFRFLQDLNSPVLAR
jgi:hypothetical protein